VCYRYCVQVLVGGVQNNSEQAARGKVEQRTGTAAPFPRSFLNGCLESTATQPGESVRRSSCFGCTLVSFLSLCRTGRLRKAVSWSKVTSGSVEGASNCATTPLDFDKNPREFHETTRTGWVAPPRQARG
jgi:hypothetical protein